MGIALVTPFTNEGQVDYISLEHLIEKQIAKGVDFLCVLGTTAETPCLTAEEKQDIIDFTVKVVNGRIPLLLQQSSSRTSSQQRRERQDLQTLSWDYHLSQRVQSHSQHLIRFMSFRHV